MKALIHLPELPRLDGVSFRHIGQFPGYCVGDNGSILSCLKTKGQGKGKGVFSYLSDEWKDLKPKRKPTGHSSVTLFRNGKRNLRYVHQIVLEEFVGPCPDGMQGCHFPDRDAANNRLTNLRWDTPKGNAADRDAHGTTISGTKVYGCKLDEGGVQKVFDLSVQGLSQRKIAAVVGISQVGVGKILRGENWRHFKRRTGAT